jgi:hypothetical protein
MAAEESDTNEMSRNLLEEALEETRERYRDEHGDDPPAAFIEDAREMILRRLAKKGRDEHRDVYDALADE